MSYPVIGALALFFLAALFGGVFYWEKRKAAKAENSTTPCAQDFIRIQDVRNGLIDLGNKEYRAIVEGGSINFFLLGEAEQEGVEGSVTRFLNTLVKNKPIQYCIQTRQVDMRPSVKRIRENAQRQNHEVIQAQAENLASFLEMWGERRSTLIRKNYLVMSASHEDPHEAYGELHRSIMTALDSLRRINIPFSTLESRDILEVLYTTMNKKRAVYAPGPKEAEELGFMNLIVEGTGLRGRDAEG